MNTELTPYLMVRTPIGFFRLAVLDDTFQEKDQAYVTFHMQHVTETPITTARDAIGYRDLGVCLAYELVAATNKDRVAKAFIDPSQALVNHAGLMAQGMGLKYTHCAVTYFGKAFSATAKPVSMLCPNINCGGAE